MRNAKALILLGLMLALALGGCGRLTAPLDRPPVEEAPLPDATHPDATLPAPTDDHPTPPSARLIFVGDIMLDRTPGEAIALGEDPFASFAAELAVADLAIGNLECPIATGGQRVQKLWNFRCHPISVPLLARHFGAVTVANNHAGDSGPEGFAEMLDLLTAGGLPYFGGGKDAEEAHTPLVVERNGLRIALLGYNEVELRSYEAGPDRPGLAWSVDEQVVSDIQAAKEKVDVLITFMHWGREYQFEPTERQQALGRMMIDAGADLVVGAHPHVTQTVERYGDGLIVYSLGNFVFDDFLDVPLELDEPSRTSWVLRVTITQDGVGEWDTLVARTDDTGFPQPISGVASPCGTPEPHEIGLCGLQ